MVGAVFAQLFKGILCKDNFTLHVLLCLKGWGLWAHFCAPSSQITSHNSSGRSTAKITFGKCENLDPRSKIDTCFQGAVVVRSTIKIKGVSSPAVIVLTRN